MPIIAYALPIVPGQLESAASFAAELEASGHRDRYDELNRRAGVNRHEEWVQRTPAGNLLVVVFDTDTPALLARQFEDDEYDRWWRERVQRIHGFDPAAAGALPESSFSWTSDS